MAEGWIMLHRKVTDHWVWQKKPFSYGQAWTDILLECNHDERKTLIKGVLITCSRGQSINSLKTWAKRWGWTVAATRHFLTLLENDDMIQTKSERVTTRLSVCNYETYQAKQHAESTQNNRKTNAEQSQSNTNNNDNNETMEEEIHTPEPRPEPKLKAKKISYAEHVRMTEEEHSKLVNEYGEDDTQKFIERLNTYKGSTGKKYKSDYMTMYSWVIQAVLKDQQQKYNGKSNGRTHTPSESEYRMLAEKHLGAGQGAE